MSRCERFDIILLFLFEYLSIVFVCLLLFFFGKLCNVRFAHSATHSQTHACKDLSPSFHLSLYCLAFHLQYLKSFTLVVVPRGTLYHVRMRPSIQTLFYAFACTRSQPQSLFSRSARRFRSPQTPAADSIRLKLQQLSSCSLLI